MLWPEFSSEIWIEATWLSSPSKSVTEKFLNINNPEIIRPNNDLFVSINNVCTMWGFYVNSSFLLDQVKTWLPCIFFFWFAKNFKNLKLQVQMIFSFLQMMCLRFSTKIWHFILIKQTKNDCHGQFLFLVGRNWKFLKLQVQISLVFKLQMSQWFVRWFNWCMWGPLQRWHEKDQYGSFFLDTWWLHTSKGKGELQSQSD